MRVFLKYVGNGASLAGVKARDLTEEEAKGYGVERLLKSGLYKRASVSRKPVKKSLVGGSENK